MFRLFAAQGLSELWKCSHLVASCVSKRKTLCLLSVRARPLISGPAFSTGSPAWKDALQPHMDKAEEPDTIDLDKWKSVMRSQAASREKVNIEDEVSDGDGQDESGDDLKLSSSLEATREMVVMWREAGKFVPEEMTDEQVQILAELTTKSARKKYLKFLAIKENLKRAARVKYLKKKEEKQRQSIEGAEEGDERGHNPTNTFIRQYWSRSLDRLLAWRTAQAMLFDQPLVFDMSYESNMNMREVGNTVSQLMEVEGWNRRAKEPFHLHFCNLQKEGVLMQELLKRYGEKVWEHLLITTSERRHVDLFPREQLVYLTADSPNVLRKFDHSKVYIIGGLVDRSIQPGLSLANAKRLKLETARLPLDEFLHWGMGAKNLTLDQMVRIMLAMKDTGNWNEALKAVPVRKHDGFHHQRKQTAITTNTARGVSNRGFAGRPVKYEDTKFKGEGPALQRPLKDYKFDKTAAVKARSSFRSNTEGRKSAGKSKEWWSKG
ncbi:tRNA methyltransferase 10 homolog C [Xyrichtys novacula]|uniref:tRNA methyltransferase 10 homolog C n=1 Tax=Xyrichtys novacula TaxID=13765 RepID=A0AAV1EMP6_XYRNO|nr:tRNA methyltransferase 10 homolog C [Xyrichtys novacula]